MSQMYRAETEIFPTLVPVQELVWVTVRVHFMVRVWVRVRVRDRFCVRGFG